MNEQTYKVIEDTCKLFSHKFPFGIHSREDIYQQSWIYCLEALPSYDESRPLKPFLFSVLYSRLINFKRNNYARTEKPCASCPFRAQRGCTLFEELIECPLFLQWEQRNAAKKSLASATEMPEPYVYDTIYDYPPDILPLIEKVFMGERLSESEKEALRASETRWNTLSLQ